MAVGWSRDGGVQDQIDASIAEAVELARSRLSDGESVTHCQECEEEIPEAPPQGHPRRPPVRPLPIRTGKKAGRPGDLQSPGQQGQSVEIIRPRRATGRRPAGPDGSFRKLARSLILVIRL